MGDMIQTEFGMLERPDSLLTLGDLVGKAFTVFRFRWDGVQFQDGHCRLHLTALWVDVAGELHRAAFPGDLQYEGPRKEFRNWLATQLRTTGLDWKCAFNALNITVHKPYRQDNSDFI